ncbi:MAG: hypothetical protein IT378_07245, partial [Sandaracinaceae bacterium]|nr:hypothetical protein [Sandaracinaceae bacterium]
MRSWSRLALISFLVTAACGSSGSSGGSSGGSSTPPPPAADAPLLEQSGELAATDTADGRGRYDRYFVDVREGDRLLVTLTSSAFDPILEVTPPGSGTLVNDDWQGDRARSQIELFARSAGSMKVEVRSYAAGGTGAYQIAVRRVPAQPSTGQNVPVLAAGQNVEGDLAQGDLRLSNGDLVDSFVVRAQGPITVHVAGRGGEAPRTTLVGPDGLTLRAGEGGRYEASAPGN